MAIVRPLECGVVDAADPREQKRAIASVFTRTSATHDTVGTPLFAHFGQMLVDRAELAAGERVLDVAAGTGATLFPTARRVGHGGRVVGIDLAPGMIDRLRAEISARGSSNAEARVADAEELPFGDESFDVVLCGEQERHHTGRKASLVSRCHALTPCEVLILPNPGKHLESLGRVGNPELH